MEVLEILKSEIGKLFEPLNFESLGSVLGRVGIFPAHGGTESEHLIEWSPVKESLDLFVETLEGEWALNETSQGNFSRAIDDVLTEIRDLGHEGGAAVLILKIGAEKNSFAELSYEEKILADLKAWNVRVLAQEIP